MEERSVIEARLEARLQELARLRAAMRRSSAGMRESELAHVDNHPGDIAGELLEEEIEQTGEIFIAEGERRIAEARRALADGSYGTCRTAGKASRRRGSRRCRRRCGASSASAASRVATASRRASRRPRPNGPRLPLR